MKYQTDEEAAAALSRIWKELQTFHNASIAGDLDGFSCLVRVAKEATAGVAHLWPVVLQKNARAGLALDPDIGPFVAQTMRLTRGKNDSYGGDPDSATKAGIPKAFGLSNRKPDALTWVILKAIHEFQQDGTAARLPPLPVSSREDAKAWASEMLLRIRPKFREKDFTGQRRAEAELRELELRFGGQKEFEKRIHKRCATNTRAEKRRPDMTEPAEWMLDASISKREKQISGAKPTASDLKSGLHESLIKRFLRK